MEVGDIKLRIGVAHGLEEAGKMLDKIRDGEEFFHAIEIMAWHLQSLLLRLSR